MARTKDLRDEPILMRVGIRVYRLRQHRGWTMKQLAARAKLHLQTVYRVELGRGCSLPTLIKIATAMGLELGELLPNIESYLNPPEVLRLIPEKPARVVSGTRNLFEPSDPSPARPVSTTTVGSSTGRPTSA